MLTKFVFLMILRHFRTGHRFLALYSIIYKLNNIYGQVNFHRHTYKMSVARSSLKHSVC